MAKLNKRNRQLLREAVAGLEAQKQLEEMDRSIDRAAISEAVKTEAQTDVDLAPHPSPSYETNVKTNEKTTCRSKNTPVWKMVIEIGAPIIGLFVAVIYICQLKAMIDSNRINRENFVSEERPIVMLYKTYGLKVEEGSPISMDITFANFGRSPALGGMSGDQAFWGPNAMKDADAFFSNVRARVRPAVPKESLWTMPPTSNCAESTNGVNHFDCLFTTVSTFDRKPISGEDAIQLRAHDNMVVFVGVESYEDSSGKDYTTRYCLRLLSGGAIAYCNKYNEVK